MTNDVRTRNQWIVTGNRARRSATRADVLDAGVDDRTSARVARVSQRQQRSASQPEHDSLVLGETEIVVGTEVETVQLATCCAVVSNARELRERRRNGPVSLNVTL